MSESSKNERDLKITDDGSEVVIEGTINVLKGRGISISGEPLVGLLEEYDGSDVKIIVQKL